MSCSFVSVTYFYKSGRMLTRGSFYTRELFPNRVARLLKEALLQRTLLGVDDDFILRPERAYYCVFELDGYRPMLITKP